MLRDIHLKRMEERLKTDESDEEIVKEENVYAFDYVK